MSNPLLTEQVGVHLIDMDNAIKEQVVYNQDSSFTILINARLNDVQQMQAYQHAIRHIMNDDFHKNDVDIIELTAHG